MRNLNSRTVIAFCTFLLALVWLYLGIYEYGVWDARHRPLPGLFPAGIAAVLLAASLAGMVQSLREKPADYRRPAFEVAASLVLLVAACFTFGMLPSLLVYFVLWQVLVEKTPVRALVLSTLVVGAIVWGVFVWWLQIPFENGIIYDLIMY
ncbi:MAG: tripartite tricarboxylate transporter TctB family protein [Methylobacteriaceae bacterium]|jgi:hypothetical protein|nr:tripartite tricarboxylate transporter TctB family protein [Methylobacteriaceae bacterium]